MQNLSLILSLPKFIFKHEKETLLGNLFDIKVLIKGVNIPISNYANTTAAIFNKLPEINWVGFYFLRNKNLILGLFQRKPACIKIPLGTGVCGIAMNNSSTLIVPDIHAFPGHIASNPFSRSEIVLPMVKDKIKIGLLDIDSPDKHRFDEIDQKYLKNLLPIDQLNAIK